MSFEKFAAARLAQRGAAPEWEELLETLLRSAREGDFCLSVDKDLPASLCEEGKEEGPLPQKPLVKQGNRLYLQKNWALETAILRKVKELLRHSLPVGTQNLDKYPLNEAQREAIADSLDKRLAIFTGGPGTGKSYTASVYIRLLSESQEAFKVAIAAPTGKAAAHLEAISQFRCKSSTLHSLLKLQPRQQRFTSEETIDADLVVVDEASMIDASLMLHLLNAIGPRSRLLLLGDPNQLPPVEGSGFFPEMASLFGKKLTRSMRTEEGSILDLATAILEGNVAKIERKLPPTDLVGWLHSRLPPLKADPAACLQEQKRFRILCALRQGPFGVDALNQALLERYRWSAIPILIVQNNAKLGLFNGTAGVLIGKQAYFEGADGIQSVPESALPRYETAFCLSVHKSQGSEFDEVLALFGPGSEAFGKEALYTAVTRAKKKVEICIDEPTLCASLNARPSVRSGFVERYGDTRT